MRELHTLLRGLCGAMLIVVLVLPFSIVYAATVSSVTDTPSTLEAGELANHTFTFVTPTGVAEGATMTFSFESDFVTAAITEDDVDVADDGIDLTTASDCTGAEEAGVVMAASTLTITICAGDGGAIAGGSTVTVEIGTNATASGTGANQITNPSAVGTYFITLAGTFGDSGSIPLPINGADAIGVSAVVSENGGGGGGGGSVSTPVVTDSTPPIISSLTVTSITATSALVQWTTNEPASSIVDYGETTAYSLGPTSDFSLVTNHSVSVSGLSESTLYHLRVRSSDGAANQVTSEDLTFSTLDVSAPVISQILVSDITESSATITWQTNEPASSVVEFGSTTSYGQIESSDVLVLSHSIDLSGLSADSLVHFRVRSTDGSAHEAVSSDATFRTIVDLPPGNVVNLSVIPGVEGNQLVWSNPSDPDANGVRILACTDTFPSGPTDTSGCVVVFEGSASAFSHTGLVAGQTVFYGVFARDLAGQFASGALGEGTPSAPEEEPPTEETQEPPIEEPTTPSEPSGSGNTDVCGDGICGPAESTFICSLDCPVAPLPEEPEPTQTPSAQCGNAVCESGETSASCAQDCPTSLPQEQVVRNSLEFYVARGTIQLPFAGDRVSVLSGRSLRIQLLIRDLPVLPERVVMTFAGQTFLLAPVFQERAGELQAAAFGDDAYVAEVTTPITPGSYASAVSLSFADGSEQSIGLTLDVTGSGRVAERQDDGTTRASSGALVTLFEADGSTIWNGDQFGQTNPQVADEDGNFAWYVPNGSYTIVVQQDGFPRYEQGVVVNDRVVRASIILVKEKEVEVLPEVPSTPVDSVLATLSQVNDGIEQLRENPAVEQAAAVSVPTLAATAAISGLTLAVSFNLLPFLQYLFTAPILFFHRRKRRGFGVVYNAISKLPVDLATVRLYRVPADGGAPRFVQSRVTDRGGRYAFLVSPGHYTISVSKNGFEFPSQVMQGKTSDVEYLDVYHGEPVEVTEQNATIAANIPMDPSQSQALHAPARIVWKRRLRWIQQVVAVGGLVASIVFAILSPSILTFFMAALQLMLYLVVKRLASAKRPKSWGIVYDRKTGKPLARAVARIFEPQYNKLLETTVTDAQGRYSFVLGPSSYYAVFQKEGYQNVEVRPVDLSRNAEPTEFSVNIPLPRTES